MISFEKEKKKNNISNIEFFFLTTNKDGIQRFKLKLSSAGEPNIWFYFEILDIDNINFTI